MYILSLDLAVLQHMFGLPASPRMILATTPFSLHAPALCMRLPRPGTFHSYCGMLCSDNYEIGKGEYPGSLLFNWEVRSLNHI